MCIHSTHAFFFRQNLISANCLFIQRVLTVIVFLIEFFVNFSEKKRQSLIRRVYGVNIIILYNVHRISSQ